MLPRVLNQVAVRIREHVERHALPAVDIVFHGGEPLLLGAKRLGSYADRLRELIPCTVGLGIQTNGTLLTGEVLDVLARHDMQVGLSIDGPKHVNDRHRIDHQNQGSFDRLDAAIRLAGSRPEWKKLLGNYLAVIDLKNAPVEIYRFFRQIEARSIDLILPDAHHDSPPARPDGDGSHLAYGAWLAEFFDAWFDEQALLNVRLFEEILVALLGGDSTHESIGAKSVDLVVVEADGAIEPVDTLKIVGRQATDIGMSVFQNSFDDALHHPALRSRMSGYSVLCDTCRSCPEVAHCGGGYLPHRFGAGKGFLNPSVYCDDLRFLFDHIRAKVKPVLERSKSAGP